MTLKQMQKDGREGIKQQHNFEILFGAGSMAEQACESFLDQHTANTWKACLATILESGLLEEKEEHQDWCKLTGELEYSSCGCWKDHNTLARDIKEFMSNMDKV